MNTSGFIPKWISIISGFISVLGLFVGASLYLSPGTFLDNIDFSTAGTRYLVYMWAARQISIAAIIGYAVLKQSVSMLKITLAAYAIMNLQDFFIGILEHDNGLAAGATVFCIIPALMAYILSKKQLARALAAESGDKGSRVI